MKIDWPSIRTEYVNGSMTYKDLADKHKLKDGTVRQRGNRDGWDKERDELTRRVTQEAQERLVEDRAATLSKFNEDDLRVARAIRAQAGRLLSGVSSPSDLRALASSFEVAQKIGRLALGANTEKSEVAQTVRNLPPIQDDDWI